MMNIYNQGEGYINYIELIIPQCLHISKHHIVPHSIYSYALSIKNINLKIKGEYFKGG